MNKKRLVWSEPNHWASVAFDLNWLISKSKHDAHVKNLQRLQIQRLHHANRILKEPKPTNELPPIPAIAKHRFTLEYIAKCLGSSVAMVSRWQNRISEPSYSMGVQIKNLVHELTREIKTGIKNEIQPNE